MTSYLTALVLIAGLLVLGLLVGIGLVLLSWLRERHDVGAIGDEPPTTTQRNRAA